ncbi:hypothetical protein JCM10213_000659 [Rhodosporidiobolus nylandii]
MPELQQPQPHTQDEPPQLGRRAKLTRDALLVASNKVARVLDDKAMRQCFPQRWADEFPDLIPGLKEMVLSTYSAGVPLAWDDLTRSANFVDKANELDRLLADAQARKEAGEEPKEAYKLGTDGTITIPSLTVPPLRSSISSLRAKREALAAKNAATYARISALSERATNQEQQNEAILAQFAASVKSLEEIDQQAIAELQDELVKVVGKDL